MSHVVECFAGPLDGKCLPLYIGGAFPWPCGWYYLERRGERAVYRWKGSAFIQADIAYWRDYVRPIVEAA